MDPEHAHLIALAPMHLVRMRDFLPLRTLLIIVFSRYVFDSYLVQVL